MRIPTDKEIEEAKEYLRQRLDVELSMRTNLQIVMIEAAKQIIDISYRYKISPELFRFAANRQLQEEVDAHFQLYVNYVAYLKAAGQLQ